MFELTPTLPNFDFGQLFIWIEANNYQINYDFLELRWVILSYVRNDSQLDLIFFWVNFWYELGEIMTRYDFLDARF